MNDGITELTKASNREKASVLGVGWHPVSSHRTETLIDKGGRAAQGGQCRREN